MITHDDLTQVPAIHGELLKTSCAYYAGTMLRGPAAAPYNGRFVVAEHHEAWEDLIKQSDRVLCLAARDHGKTFFWDFAYPIWRAESLPHGRGYIFSATQDQAVRILTDIKDEIEDNPKLRHLMPVPREVWNQTSIKLANGHRIYARGFGTKIRGAHPNWIVVDDGLNDEDGYSEVTRKKHIDYFYTAITNMVIPGGQIVVVGTPYHAADLYAELARNKRYTVGRFPALNAAGEPLWPMRYSRESLLARKEEIGSLRFTREFLVSPVSDSMSLFPGHLFRGQPTEQMSAVLGQPGSFWKSHGIKSVFIGVDLAISSSTGADFFVIFVLGLDANGNRWVLDIERHQGLPYQEQLSRINAAGRKYQADLIFIEANQMQRVFGDELIRTTDLPIKKFITTGVGKGKASPGNNTVTANKNSMEGGAPSLRVMLENGKFRIPRGDARSVEITEQWISEMQAFTWQDGKLQGVGEHDDTVMACVPPGHKVTTLRGLIPIESVRVGDMVLTHRSRWRAVTALSKREHKGPIVRLETEGGRVLPLTPEHPVFCSPSFMANGSWDFRPAAQMVQRMFVAHPAPGKPPDAMLASDAINAGLLGIVKSVDLRQTYEGPVHNFHVAEDESYAVEGIAVHNCWIADQAVRRGGFSFSMGPEDTPAQATQQPQAQQPQAQSAPKQELGLQFTQPDSDQPPRSSGNLVGDLNAFGAPAGVPFWTVPHRG